MRDSGHTPHRQPGGKGFALAHLSDLHVTAVRIGHARELLSKRALGYLAWRRRRRREHQPEVLDALLRDLAEAAVDHIAVTGDLTHLGLPSEIEAAARWLRRIGPPQRVSLVPGNHDALAGREGDARFAPWAAYLRGDDAPPPGAPLFPSVRRIGPIGVVGLSSARPTLPLLATGRLGREQLERLEIALRALARDGLFRIVLLHHPPLPCGQSRRRRLDDAAALRALLERHGAELVLHGHTHRSSFETLPGPRGPIPVVSVPSATSVGRRRERRARYHVYRITWPAEGSPPQVSCSARRYDEGGAFAAAGSRVL